MRGRRRHRQPQVRIVRGDRRGDRRRDRPRRVARTRCTSGGGTSSTGWSTPPTTGSARSTCSSTTRACRRCTSRWARSPRSCSMPSSTSTSRARSGCRLWWANGWWPTAAGRSSTSARAGRGGPRPEQLPYSAAKAGLNALTEGLALAFGPTVRVNTLMPGPFLTDISKAWDIPATTTGRAALRASAARQSARDHRRRSVSGVRRVELHQRIDHPRRRRHPVATDSKVVTRHGDLTRTLGGQ